MVRHYLQELLRRNQTVFSFKELLFIWAPVKPSTARERVSYYIRTGALYHIRNGLYAKDKEYTKFEVATKIYRPSYISFETVLGASGITFQYYSQIFLASYQTKEIICDGQKYGFREISPDILADTRGITIKPHYSIATPERAFLDTLYTTKQYYFDNLSPLNWDSVSELMPLYEKREGFAKRVEKFHQFYLDNK